MHSFELDDKPREKCAVAGVISLEGAAIPTVEALRSLQHRGQEFSGTVSMEADGTIAKHRERGLVSDVYTEEDVAKLTGSLAVGHNRYSTNGSKKKKHQQPVVDESIGFAFGHNGNLPVTDKLEKTLKKHNVITSQLNDSEMMARTIATHIRNGRNLPDAVAKAYKNFQGAFSCVAMHDNQIVAFRDEMGIRPLAFGDYGKGGWVTASETCALDAIGANFIREVRPGEMLILSPSKPPESRQLAEGQEKLDMFEFVYFARPDSLLYGQRVSEVRRRFGEELAAEHGQMITSDPENTIVIPVPDTSIPAAEGFADALGLRHRQGIIKDRYIGRTFLSPSQEARQQQLKRKHNIIPDGIEGKDLIVIDDSIVRLNTLPIIVNGMYAAGAKSVTVLIASPPVRYPDFYGIDTPSQNELFAVNHDIREMTAKTGVQYLGFLSISNMVRATRNPIEKFSLSSFNGEYPVSIGDWANSIKSPVSSEYMN